MRNVAIIAFAAQALPAAMAFCCPAEHPVYAVGAYCLDGTDATPCCATESCNLFCCACGGTCRNDKKLLRERDPGVEAFALADSAGNGNLTMDRKLADCATAIVAVADRRLLEYLEHMGVNGQPEIWTDWFKKHDKNGDGVITEDGIDSR